MSSDNLRKALNKLDDEFNGDYDALLEEYIKLRYQHQGLKVAILLCVLAGILALLI